jgi:hypothetical protein
VSGDGKPDLAVANISSNTVSVLLGNGAGGFGTMTEFAAGTSPLFVAIGDVSGDGRPDLAVANYNSSTVSVLLGLVPTQISLVASPNSVVLGAPITLTATVAVPSPGYGAPTDSVRFFDGTTRLGTSPVNGGVAALALFSSRLGSRTITAVYKGDGRLLGRISAPQTQRVVATAVPAIAGITDVSGDQGHQVRLRFLASPFDHPGSGTPIVRYDVFRQIVENPALRATPPPQRPHGLSVSGGAQPQDILVDGWDFAGSLRAYADSAYNLVVPTLADSNASGLHRTSFFVRAATTTPNVFYDSPPDSGYSVDNLPPAPPFRFNGDYQDGASHLHWGPNSEPDLWHYRVYRGSTADFVPGPENLIATRSDTSYVDPGPMGNYYKLSAMDVNYNEGGHAVLGPVGSASVPGGGPLAFALAGVRPNPSRGERLRVVFSLPDAAPARLDLLDVGGRVLARREFAALGAGEHTLDLSAGLHLTSGIYLVRLTRGASVRVVRVAVVK